MNLAEILISLGDKEGFLAMGANAVKFQREGVSRPQDDTLSRFWLAERLGHYAHMCLRQGRTDDAIKFIAEARDLIAEARQLIADGSLPESLHAQRNLLLGSFDQMESELRSAMNPAPGAPTPDP